eukprot:CAMPEP_0181098622 /NCGR_PEP_ID=MMETSP1071-20121207/12224_1 /TAXON_ID=35127 /ORGANISM="Thalassiosira sp., Strain NH16" /LENGTH=1253 /DNA_ID=CAMNT_0023181229 /DNA_START=92 /DNA_END=3850 /DNA_ORIENTATION=+
MSSDDEQQSSIDKGRRRTRASTLLAGILLIVAVAGTIVAMIATEGDGGGGGGENNTTNAHKLRRREEEEERGAGSVVMARRPRTTTTTTTCSTLIKQRDCRRDVRCSYDKDSKTCVPRNDGGVLPASEAVTTVGRDRDDAPHWTDNRDPCVGKIRSRCRNDPSCMWGGRSSGCSSIVTIGSEDEDDEDVITPQSEAVVVAPKKILWWPDSPNGADVECVHSSDYPAFYAKKTSGGDRPLMVFETRMECCAAYPCDDDDDYDYDEQSHGGDEVMDDPEQQPPPPPQYDPEQQAPPPPFPILHDPMPNMGEPLLCVTGSGRGVDGDTPSACPPGQFCHANDGGGGASCGEGIAGACTPRPAFCAEIYDPVCGCDGASHSSACHAYMAGIDVRSEGGCVEGAAEDDAAIDGVVVPVVMCPMVWAPVCASDGRVYSNACGANAAGFKVSYEIESPPDNLAPQSACDLTKPTTQGSMPVGMCPKNWRPVCASDGRVYSNACGANAAGFKVSYEIEPRDKNLEALSVCDVKKPATQGTQIMCPMDWTPVCASDGRIYSNGCEANAAGLKVSYEIESPAENLELQSACTVTKPKASPTPVTPRDDDTQAEEDGPSVIISGMPLPDAHVEDPPPTDTYGHYAVEGQCYSDSDCTDGLVCHAASGQCTCEPDSNAGCSPGQICGVPPGLYCPMGGCIPMCACDHLSNAVDGSNGCPAGEVCRQPCAMADAGVMCFASERERDCDVYGSGFVCRDSNGDGIIDGRDGSSGCERDVVAPPPPAEDPPPMTSWEDAHVEEDKPFITALDMPMPDIHAKAPGLDPSNLDHDNVTSLHDCSSRLWHESTTMKHVCTNDGEHMKDWTLFMSGNECCDVVFHNAECHLVDACDELLLRDPRTFEVFPVVELEGVDNTDSGGRPLEDCLSVPWHAAAEDDEPASSCTNSGDYPEHWATAYAEGYLFKSAEDCCEVHFPDGDCPLVDVCEPRDGEVSRYGDVTRGVPIMATVSALNATSSTVAAATAIVDTADATTVEDEPCQIEGHCRSPSGHCGPHMICEEDPCADATACAAGATCQANSCGGCHPVCSSDPEDAVFAAPAAGLSAGERDDTGRPPEEDEGEEEFFLVESDILDIDGLPWDYGGSPTQPEWHIDRDTWPTTTITNVDITRFHPGATTDLTLRLHLPQLSTLRCRARIETDMPFDYFIIFVDGEMRRVYYHEIDRFEPLTVGLLEGDRTVVFRVENGDINPEFNRDEHGGEHGSGRVWLD